MTTDEGRARLVLGLIVGFTLAAGLHVLARGPNDTGCLAPWIWQVDFWFGFVVAAGSVVYSLRRRA